MISSPPLPLPELARRRGRYDGRSAADQIRAGDQSASGTRFRRQDPANDSWPRRRGHRMNRRELILLLGSVIIAARGLRAQQKAMPVMGYLSSTAPGAFA